MCLVVCNKKCNDCIGSCKKTKWIVNSRLDNFLKWYGKCIEKENAFDIIELKLTYN